MSPLDGANAFYDLKLTDSDIYERFLELVLVMNRRWSSLGNRKIIDKKPFFDRSIEQLHKHLCIQRKTRAWGPRTFCQRDDFPENSCQRRIELNCLACWNIIMMDRVPKNCLRCNERGEYWQNEKAWNSPNNQRIVQQTRKSKLGPRSAKLGPKQTKFGTTWSHFGKNVGINLVKFYYLK